MAAALAENYQLKWHSHGTHLHSSIVTLQRSESFADVTLATSDGCYLAAHRFVLSACSSYLHQLLEIGSVRSSPNGSLVVVLPSEITYSTLTILLQYMYSGEATVSNEQLNSVLKAGELLRVRGLCHTKENIGQPRTGGVTRILSQQSENLPKKSAERGLNCSADIKRASTDKASLGTIDQNEQESQKFKSVSKNNNADKCRDLKTPVPEDIQEVVTDFQKENRESCKKKNGVDNASRSERVIESDIMLEETMQIELSVKEEPIDWEDMIDRDHKEGPIDDHYLHTELTIKAEAYSSTEEQEDDDYYAPLTCDLCQETFTTPALWVRHVESHPTADISRHRRKRQLEDNKEDEEIEYPPLRCELCQEVFGVPADWVRHIQSAHTEDQLAASNKARRSRGGGGGLLQVRKHCRTCGKSFPSHASMLIHSRTHTGERPYVCHVCEKGFNVKSNLLRHLRTLHDQIITPSMVQ